MLHFNPETSQFYFEKFFLVRFKCHTYYSVEEIISHLELVFKKAEYLIFHYLHF